MTTIAFDIQNKLSPFVLYACGTKTHIHVVLPETKIRAQKFVDIFLLFISVWKTTDAIRTARPHATHTYTPMIKHNVRNKGFQQFFNC